jgi:hypothetical protein
MHIYNYVLQCEKITSQNLKIRVKSYRMVPDAKLLMFYHAKLFTNVL